LKRIIDIIVLQINGFSQQTAHQYKLVLQDIFPMSFNSIIGHDRQIDILSKTLECGRFPHAYLFWGPDGVGKEMTALAAAKALLCAAPIQGMACNSCPSCSKVKAGSHPDLHLLVAEKASISIKEIRALRTALSFQSFERGAKIAIIRDAFKMTREAGNSLLKTLEEPPEGTHIFLLSHHRNQLLPTLVSRCRSLRFGPISEATVADLLEKRGVDKEKSLALAQISGGCPGAVWDVDPESHLSIEQEAAELWDKWDNLGAAELFDLSSRWASERDLIEIRFGFMEKLFLKKARAAAENGRVDSRAVNALDSLFSVRRMIDRNINVQLTLDCFFMKIIGEEV